MWARLIPSDPVDRSKVWAKRLLLVHDTDGSIPFPSVPSRFTCTARRALSAPGLRDGGGAMEVSPVGKPIPALRRFALVPPGAAGKLHSDCRFIPVAYSLVENSRLGFSTLPSITSGKFHCKTNRQLAEEPGGLFASFRHSPGNLSGRPTDPAFPSRQFLPTRFSNALEPKRGLNV